MEMRGGSIGWGRRASTDGHGRGRHRRDQARSALLGALLLAGGCSAGQGPEAIGPIARYILGPAYEGREEPPGVEAPYPNLGTIPPRPALPDPALRDRVTAALAEERDRSRDPLDPERRPVPIRRAGTPGDAAMPMRPPAPPPLARAPAISWEEPRPTAAPGPAVPPAPVAMPDTGTAPPPPPPAELLLPGAAPPPPPPAELMAPSRR